MACGPEYWIWLQKSVYPGERVHELLAYFGSPEKLYEAGKNEWMLSGAVSKNLAENLIKRNPSESYRVMEECGRKNWHIITPDMEEYPPLLLRIENYPLALYVWGDKNILTAKVPLAVVGTRGATDYGIKVAKSLTYDLGSAGVTVVSGGALGVDSAAHTGAMDAGGKTIAFLGCGLGSNYLHENKALRERISRNGAVVSEFMPDVSPTRMSFPIRNRLISGMSLGVLVIEAGEKSGSLITARCAFEQNRDVFAVPG
ncbi:MAG: DNA-processing protein DprA, partial [Oscillospiraceae bacterium]|nr:DNA-processing protein DprA [Oscillospiraceae bacterium]